MWGFSFLSSLFKPWSSIHAPVQWFLECDTEPECCTNMFIHCRIGRGHFLAHLSSLRLTFLFDYKSPKDRSSSDASGGLLTTGATWEACWVRVPMPTAAYRLLHCWWHSAQPCKPSSWLLLQTTRTRGWQVLRPQLKHVERIQTGKPL